MGTASSIFSPTAKRIFPIQPLSTPFGERKRADIRGKDNIESTWLKLSYAHMNSDVIPLHYTNLVASAMGTSSLYLPIATENWLQTTVTQDEKEWKERGSNF